MSLWDEALAFKDKHGLYFHPLHNTKERIDEIEKNNRKCPCYPKERKCICDQALIECKTKGSCACLVFCTKEYLVKWGYIDEKAGF